MSNHNFWIILITTTLFISGCAYKTPTVTKKPVLVEKPAPVPQKVHKKGELVEVEDTNFSSAYMYPEEKAKKEKVIKVAKAESTPTMATTMNREECIRMIGQEKFDQYTHMFGNEASSIKRCAMLKAMN